MPPCSGRWPEGAVGLGDEDHVVGRRRGGDGCLGGRRAVCDSAAAEQCPVFFGGPDQQPVKVHWGYPDPSNAEGGEVGKRRAFELTRQALAYRMLQFLALPLDSMDRLALKNSFQADSAWRISNVMPVPCLLARAL